MNDTFQFNSTSVLYFILKSDSPANFFLFIKMSFALLTSLYVTLVWVASLCTYKGFKLNKLNYFGVYLFFTLDLALLE